MKLYCSKCGIELTHSRQAVPRKGHIFDVVDPHDCEGYAIKSNDEEHPTVIDILSTLKSVGSAKVISDGKNEAGRYTEPGDLRNDKSDVTSTAPGGLLRSMRDLATTEEGDLE